MHVINECERVRLAVQAMKTGNMEFLGKLLYKSHESLSKLYEVTGRELDALAYAAQEHPACAGSRKWKILRTSYLKNTKGRRDTEPSVTKPTFQTALR